MAKTKKQLKQEQANMQSDNMEMAGWSEGLMTGGVVETATVTSTVDSLDATYEGMTYSFGELDAKQLDLFDEKTLQDKYPALKQAWEHYKSVLEVCKTKEKEEDEN